MRRLAVLSFHTSPLAQAGTGDGGGMNVYVRELSSALAAAGVACDVYTRAWRAGLAPTVRVGPGLRVHHLVVGPPELLALDQLVELVDEFTEGVARRFTDDVLRPDVIHANYWLSGLSGHVLKHRFGLPLVTTFHSLARVKAEADIADHSERARAEAEIVGCSDSIVVSSDHEASELVRLYGAAPERTEVVPPGVDHTLFRPGSRARARAELGLDDGPVLLFVGRIQPLKGLDVAVRALAALEQPATLVVVGGPSGPDGQSELARVRELVARSGLERRVRLVRAQPHSRLVTFYRAADVCLVPSRSESFGLVALEAAACGTPVVAAGVGGLRTVVDHGVTGFLVPASEPEAFAAAAAVLLEDPALASAMGERAAARAEGFRWSMTAARLRRLYADLTARQLVECQ